jgi:hypothetical protein
MALEFPYIRPFVDGQILGANTGLNILTARNQWLYGKIMTPYTMFKQKRLGGGTEHFVSGEPSYFWEGVTTYRADHPTLYISAAWLFGSTEEPPPELDPREWHATLNLQLWCKQGGTFQWYTIESETIIHAASGNTCKFFKDSQWYSIDLSDYVLPTNLLQNDAVRVRFWVTEVQNGNTEEGWIHVFCAYMDGWVGHDNYVIPVTFTDTLIHDAADFNTLVTAQEFVYNKVCRNELSMYTQRLEHTQETAWEVLDNLVFRYTGQGELYLQFRLNSVRVGGGMTVSIKSFDFVPESLLEGSGTYDQDLSPSYDHGDDASTITITYHLPDVMPALTPWEWYRLEFRATDGVSLSLIDVYIQKEATEGRLTALPLWEHLDNPSEVDVNLLVTDIDNMADPIAGDYPATRIHMLNTFMNAGSEPETDHTGNTHWINTNPSYGIWHRHRWLRWIGAGTIESRSGQEGPAPDYTWIPDFSTSLPDSKELINETYDDIDANKVSVMQTLDLDSVSWLAYGMIYAVRGVEVAFEDYDL